ncbi:N-acyl-D-amino-acid deacylase family protein [Erythrobacter sp. NE805]|uniref:N-acyl-D-amino-acid deacylase family protein n=1 Tax=Erythrobacter sp. NE805 TaxID=3389875 RepID=UPI00396B0617
MHVDRIIANAVLVDGTGRPPFRGALAVSGERIAGVGALEGWTADTVCDAGGKVLAPGFIDAHTHDDAALLEGLLEPKISQGVTSVVTGNCGVSLAPLALGPGEALPAPLDSVADRKWFRFERFADWLEALRAAGTSTNVVPLIGHGTLRVKVMDALDRPATEAEIAAMEALVDEAMAAGAFGVSSGLFYPLAAAAPASEVVRLARRAAAAGGLYTAHLRDEADAVVAALEEAIAIAAEAGLPLVVSHHKVSGARNHGRSTETLALIARAAQRQPVYLDAYPYTAGSTTLNERSWAAASRTLITWCAARPELAGRDLAEVARELGLSEVEAIRALRPAGAVYFMMDESDVERILCCPATMIGSDGIPADRHPHPRLWGSFARVLGHYSRDRGLFPLEEAVHRMTGLTAARFGLAGRGVLAEGAQADLVMFDAREVREVATFADPRRPSAGIAWVMVNGVTVWEEGRATGARPGRIAERRREAA